MILRSRQGYDIYFRRIVVRSPAWKKLISFTKRPAVWGLIPRGGKKFLCSAPVFSGPGTHQAFTTMCTGFCPWVKRPGRVFDHLLPNGAEIKSEKYYTSNPPACHLDMFQGELYLLQNIQIISRSHAYSCSVGSGASFSGLKRPGHHLLPKFKNQWSYTSVLPCDFMA